MHGSLSPRLTKRRKLLVGTAIVALFLTTVVLGLRGREASSEAPRRVSGLTSTGSGNSTTQPDHEYTNQLIHETSPYLLQHAHNPVNWYSWGKDALQKAKEQDKPIFLSVGYSTCYWCHVMERESFEKEDVAKILNEHFIAIKVDREERPEIDEQYMLATQLVTGGGGGWPNSVWLTPDGRPWMAGTYFPREQFKQVLTQLAEIWKTRRPEVEQQADQLAQAIQRIGSGQNVQSAKPVNQQLVDQAIGALQQSFDARRGGFGGAPKFPPHGSLRLLIHEYRPTKDR
ncbi:MAG: thioredoxin domain-containing protein, partial [Planctomycetes bacterium]|nr:thioredoxin domain-containing protein [Planctomycetota bacterium]